MLATILLVIAVLLVMVFTGKLDIQQPKLVISSASHSITYDGKKLVDGKWSLMEGSLKEGHKLSVSVTGSQTNVGMSENYITAAVLNANGEDVSDEYTIEYRPGALQVKARELTIMAGSDMKLYDGTPLTCDSYMLQSSVALLSTDQLLVTVEGSITEIGKTDNVITSAKVVSKATGEDVSRNYSIHSKNGKLIIYDENALVIKSGDDMKVYDGTPLTGVNTECVIENGELREGHSMEITYTGSQLLPGSSENTFNVRIVDAEGNDVTNTYQILKNYGWLIVKNASLQITDLNAQAEYGSNSFSSMEYTYDGLPQGHTIDVSGALEDAFGDYIPVYWTGSLENSIDTSTIKILDADGNDVSDCFDITDLSGTLTVNEDYPCFIVKTSDEGDIYLKQRSYGDYDLETKSWRDAPEYIAASSAISSPYYLTSSALGLMQTSKAEITPKAGIFALPYYALDKSGNQQQRSDVLMEGDAYSSYTVEYVPHDMSKMLQRSLANSDSVILDYEDPYYSFVKENYLSVDPETMAYMQEYVTQNNLYANNDRALVAMVAEHLRNSAQSGLIYNMLYDTNMDEADNPTIAFLRDYREGVCRHYAQAATLLYRSLGIPARYTVGFYGYSAVKNQEFVITNKQAHAWVEVYFEDLGWVCIEVTGSRPTLKLTPKNIEKLYDKNNRVALRAKELLAEGMEEWSTLAALGYTIQYDFDKGLTDPGKAKSSVFTCTIQDASGNVVYQYENGYATLDAGIFRISYGQGNIHLYRAEIRLNTGNYKKMYGDEWTHDLSTKSIDDFAGGWRVLEGEVLAGHTFTATPIAAFNTELYKPGKYGNTYRIVGDGAYTDEYKYTCSGELTITARSLIIDIGDATAVYDGTPKTYEDATTKEDTREMSYLAFEDYIDWDTMVFSISETVINVGDFALVTGEGEALKIYDSQGRDVSECYSISFAPGLLEIVAP